MFYKTLRSVIPFAQQLESKGISLGLPQNSHLAPLVRYSQLDNPTSVLDADQFIASVQDCVIMDGASTEHENFMGALVDDLVPLVQTHVKMSREIGTLSISLANIVRQYYENAPEIEASASFNIVKDDLSEIFDETSAQAVLSEKPYYNRQNLRPLTAVSRDPEWIKSELMTGNSQYDTALISTIDSYDGSFLQTLWAGLFMSPSGDNPYSLEKLGYLPCGERLLVAYIGQHLAEKLRSKVPDDAVGTLASFQEASTDIRDFLTHTAAAAFEEYQTLIRNKTLVTGYNPGLRQMTVNGPVYREWLDQGGSPEILLGALISDCSSYTVNQVNQASDRYRQQWVSYCAFHNAETDVRQSKFLRASFLVAFVESMVDIQPYEEEFRKSNSSFAESANKTVESFLEGLSLEALRDFEAVALHLVAGIRFSYTPAKLILQDIDRTMKSTPDADVREAALVAAANYVMLYQAGQISVHKQ